MIKDVEGKELKVGQVIKEIFFDEEAEVLELSNEDEVKVKFLKDGFFNTGEIVDINTKYILIIA